MDKQEFVKGINKLELAYSRKFSTEQLQLWYEKLKGMNYKKFDAKIEELITTDVFMPSLAEFTSKSKNQYCNYNQRDYSNMDFSELYANKGE